MENSQKDLIICEVALNYSRTTGISQDGVRPPLLKNKRSYSGSHASQLYRYFSAVQEVRFGVLTNGIVYRFFSDIEAENLMDDKPFFELNLLEIRESLVEELKKFTKTTGSRLNIMPR